MCGRLVKLLCANDMSGPPLPASLLAVSGVPGPFPVEQGWARDAEHSIRPRRAEEGSEALGWGQKYI
jgi:hypothetical protein